MKKARMHDRHNLKGWREVRSFAEIAWVVGERHIHIVICMDLSSSDTRVYQVMDKRSGQMITRFRYTGTGRVNKVGLLGDAYLSLTKLCERFSSVDILHMLDNAAALPEMQS